ncbi:hypothetical protein PLESTB_001107500 [Pleodorina starrii]|uniref:Uncharacterized protein n=1 Tax=Pleodorina starrii TaxID=330485 RepID=A0A9W6BQI4_9CHLO|nr:hypothetical protein PLESTM_001342600 [Pleodorina starrii]GLC56464.1 hypothetical protein PLESTB_001107500 [Pleodorina starrii]GLC68964.1 hypothetical protein PLESTF_000763700 [Pleodorina starrii]
MASQSEPASCQTFVGDVHNMVLDYCADGVDAFLGCVAPPLEGALTSAGASIVGDGLLAEGSQRLYNSLVAKASSSLELFEHYCANKVFQKPVQVSLPQMDPASLPCARADAFGADDTENEEQLLARIASLRQEIRKVDRRCVNLHQELQRVDKVISSCGDTSYVQAAASTALGNKKTILAIAEAAEQLQEIMDKAARLRAGSQQAAGTKQGIENSQVGPSGVTLRSTSGVDVFAQAV